MLDLASHIVKTKAGHFDTDKFEDQYEDALKELLKKKQEGKPIERPERPKPTNVVNLMDALRQSVEASGAATSTKAKARAASSRSSSEKAEHPKPKRTRLSRRASTVSVKRYPELIPRQHPTHAYCFQCNG
jgi:DNA end-binding protein Ku